MALRAAFSMTMIGSGEHRRQDRVLEPVREMLGLDEEAEGAFGSKGYLAHGLPSKGRSDESEQCSNPYRNCMLHDPSYEPFWTMAEEFDFSIGFYEGSNAGMPVVGVDRFEDRAPGGK